VSRQARPQRSKQNVCDQTEGLRVGVGKSASEPGITGMDFWMEFGFVYGILRCKHHHTENTEITQKHGK